jgi:hypothetical protein
MLRKHADIRAACELHTPKLCDSFADPDSYSDCDGAIANTDCYSDCDGAIANTDSNCYSNSNCNCYSNGDPTAAVYTDATASSDAATSAVGSGTSLPLTWELANPRVPSQILVLVLFARAKRSFTAGCEY